MSTRVRFAPSPTGNLHLGSARTALFNWLYARATGGRFLLRIEDTDLERSTDESRDAVIEALEWLGMGWDEEMVLQSERRDVHVELAEKLLAEGKAYKCFATEGEIAQMRQRAMDQGRTRTYERTWRDRTDHPAGQPHVVRFKMPIEGTTTLHDQVLGDITVDNDNLEDFVILRSDGSPVYNFVVVCDDAFMRISHVIRGQDHVANTFKQIHLYDALGEPLPAFAHLPLIDGLSKRKGSVSVQHYRDIGYPAEAVVNYVARLGWSHGDTELISPDELCEVFSLDHVNRSSSTYDDTKFEWVSSQWMQRLAPADLAERLLPFLADRDIDTDVTDALVELVAALAPRSHTLVAMAEQCEFAFAAPTAYADKAVRKWMKTAARQAYSSLIEALRELDEWTAPAIEQAFADVLERHDLKMGKLAQPVRVAITGDSVSPPIDVTLSVVGRDESLRRLEAAAHLFPQ